MKSKIDLIDSKEVDVLYNDIKKLIEESRNRVYKTINTEMIKLYWNIGKMTIEKQSGNKKAKYNDYITKELSIRLTTAFGKGFSKRNLERKRKFYLCYPIATTLSSQLSWSHYLELIKIEDDVKRNFYMHECINSNWNVRELARQRSTLLYERVYNAEDKNKILEISNKGFIVNEPKDIIKDPFVLEFLDIKENTNYLESDLEKNILNHLKEFLLEWGKGFTYVGNQVRITLDTEHYYPDLLFYNRILKSFVIIDLKIGKVTHKDIGQMQMYVNYYDRNVKALDENKTIGILLSTDKNETIVKYTLPEDNNTIFSAEFKLTIPSKQEFINVIEDEKRLYRRNQARRGNYNLNKTAINSGVKNLARVYNAGYKGLYNGQTADDIAKRKKLRYKEDILDNIGSEELADNIFRIAQTDAKLKRENVDNEYTVNSAYMK